nr:MAG TPA: hypothetical protein [Caudoviricetes sp.]
MTLGVTLFYVFDHIHPPNKDEKKRIDPIFNHLPPPFIPYKEGYSTMR